MELHELLRRVLLLAHDIEKRDPAFLKTLQNHQRLTRSCKDGTRLRAAMLNVYIYKDIARCQKEMIDRCGNICHFERQHDLRVDPAAEAHRNGELDVSNLEYNLATLRKLAATSQALEVMTALVTFETYFTQLKAKQGAVDNALS